MWIFRSHAQAARDALAELIATTPRVDPTPPQQVVKRWTNDDVRREIATWIEDAQAVPEWRRILSVHGF